MRIAHVDSEPTWRGGQAQIAGLVRGLREHGHRSYVYCPEGPLHAHLRERGFEPRTFHSGTDFQPFAAWRLSRGLRRDRAELVHLHSGRAHAVGALAARLAGGLPVVVSRRVDFPVQQTPLSKIKYRFGVDRYLCISKGVERVLHESGIGPHRTRLVPSGIDLDRWNDLPDATPLRAALGLDSGAPVVGALSALAPHKDHATLLRAARAVRERLPTLRWVVFGEGECRSALESLRAELGLEEVVLFPGFVEDVRRAMALLRVYVHSSYLEGLGTSLLDAQAAGVPVVATAVGGVPEIVESGRTGWLVPPRDPEALGSAVLEAIQDSAESRRRVEASRVRVARFSMEEMVRGTIEVYRELLTGTGPEGVADA